MNKPETQPEPLPPAPGSALPRQDELIHAKHLGYWLLRKPTRFHLHRCYEDGSYRDDLSGPTVVLKTKTVVHVAKIWRKGKAALLCYIDVTGRVWWSWTHATPNDRTERQPPTATAPHSKAMKNPKAPKRKRRAAVRSSDLVRRGPAVIRQCVESLMEEADRSDEVANNFNKVMPLPGGENNLMAELFKQKAIWNRMLALQLWALLGEPPQMLLSPNDKLSD